VAVPPDDAPLFPLPRLPGLLPMIWWPPALSPASPTRIAAQRKPTGWLFKPGRPLGPLIAGRTHGPFLAIAGSPIATATFEPRAGGITASDFRPFFAV
jgi:hypothetical protein